MACLFCAMTDDRIIDSNDLAYTIRDGFPVTPLHTLIIPKRHAEDYFDPVSWGFLMIELCGTMI